MATRTVRLEITMVLTDERGTAMESAVRAVCDEAISRFDNMECVDRVLASVVVRLDGVMFR